MKLRVILLGTLGHGRTGYDPSRGLEIEIPDGGTAKDLLGHPDISISKNGVVSVEGRILRPDDGLPNGAVVHVLQPVFGG